MSVAEGRELQSPVSLNVALLEKLLHAPVMIRSMTHDDGEPDGTLRSTGGEGPIPWPDETRHTCAVAARGHVASPDTWHQRGGSSSALID